MQIGFYFDQSRCIGCYTCVAACRSWSELDQDMPDLITLEIKESGEFPNLSMSPLFLTCFHCARPACVTACPMGLLVKRAEDGIVVITDAQQCTRCLLCLEDCPYDAPKMVSSGRVNIVKCDLCNNRISEGAVPACMAACPTEAIDIGPMEKLIAKYGESREIEGFPDHQQTYPSIIFKAGSLPWFG